MFRTAVLCLLLLCATARADSDFLGKPPAAWLKQLTDPRPDVRRGAAFALGKCGSAGAVPDLVRALRDGDAGVRDAAAFALGEIAAERPESPPWDSAGGPLRQMLSEEKDARARRSAACAIGQFGPDAAEAREDLEQALGDKDPAVRQNAAWALGRLKDRAGASGVGRLAHALQDDDPGVRRDAAAALAEVGRPTAASAVRDLVGCLVRDKAPEVRSVAVGSLVALIGPEDKAVAADLRRLLKDDDRDLRRGAALALAKIGGDNAREAVPILIDALRDDDAGVRELAAAALANVGEAAGEAVQALGKALSDRSPDVRRNAAIALTHVGPKVGEVVRPLVRALDPKEPAKVRQYAAEALGEARDAIDTVVPELLAVVREDRDTLVRQRVVMALRHVSEFEKSGTAKGLGKVLEETGREARVVRYDAARVLAHVIQDRAAPKAVDVLVDMLNDPSLREYKGTDSTLKKGDEEKKSGTGEAEKLGDDARYMAAQALAEIARSGQRKDALSALKKAAESTDEIQKKVARDALKSIGQR
jgi:HEAT repeat protein